MKVEHVAFVVRDPVAVADWYVRNLGFRVVSSGGAPTFTHFLADSAGSVMIEIYNNPKVNVPDYAAMDPLVLHLAFSVEDVKAVRQRLIAAGATAEGDIIVTDSGDELAMLRDPWGFPIQLARRSRPMP